MTWWSDTEETWKMPEKFDFSMEMTTFAMDVETPPLYKGLETGETISLVSFFAVFVCILSEIRMPGKSQSLQLIDT